MEPTIPDVMELDEEFIVIGIPDATLELDITARIYTGRGESMEVTRHMDLKEVREAIQEAKDGYIPKNAVFTLVKTGEDKIEDLVRRYCEIEDETS